MAPRTGGSVLIFVVLVAVIMCFVPSTRADGSIESLINSINSTVSGNASANATLTAVGGLLNQFLSFNTSSLSQAEILQLQSAIADLVSDLISQPLAADASNVADIVGVLDDATSNPALLSVDLVNSIVSFLLTSPNPPVFTETYVTDLLDVVSALLTGPSSRRRTSNLLNAASLLTLQNKLLVSVAGFANANLGCEGTTTFTYATSTYSVIAQALDASTIANLDISLTIGSGDSPVTFATGSEFATTTTGCIFYVYFNENFDPFPSNSSLYSTISDIGTLSFYDSNGNDLPFSNLPSNGLVTVSLPVSGDDATNAEVVCVFYDYNLGDWSSAGCTKDTGSTSANTLVCDCDHLTTFAAGLSSNVIYDSAYPLTTGEISVTSDVVTSAKNCLGYDPSLNATITGFKAITAGATLCCTTLGFAFDANSCSLPRCNAAATTESNYVTTLASGAVPQACLVNCFQSSSTVPAVTFFNGAKASGQNPIPSTSTIPTTRTVFATASTGVVTSAYIVDLTQTRRRGLQRRSLTGNFGCIGKGSVVDSQCVIEGCNTGFPYNDYFYESTGTTCFVDCYAKN